MSVDPRTAQILHDIVDAGIRARAWNVQSISADDILGQVPPGDAAAARRLLWALHTAKSHMDGITPLRPRWLDAEDSRWLDAVLDAIVAKAGRPAHPDTIVEDFIASMLPS